MLLLPKGLQNCYFGCFMKISKELIEKYHDGNCSDEEIRVVENWLSDENEEEDLLLPDEIKVKHRDEMWDEVASVLPEKKKETKIISFKKIEPVWRVAAAALIIGLLGIAVYNLKNSSSDSAIIVINNTSETVNKDLNEQAYNISIGPKSNIEINNETGIIDFCGAVMINPKRDIEFTIQGTCANAKDGSEKMTLKKGLNYIALNYSSATKANEVIILEQGSLTGLPPLMKRQLLHQFDI
jgi:hypothetical protein